MSNPTRDQRAALKAEVDALMASDDYWTAPGKIDRAWAIMERFIAFPLEWGGGIGPLVAVTVPLPRADDQASDQPEGPTACNCGSDLQAFVRRQRGPP